MINVLNFLDTDKIALSDSKNETPMLEAVVVKIPRI